MKDSISEIETTNTKKTLPLGLFLMVPMFSMALFVGPTFFRSIFPASVEELQEAVKDNSCVLSRIEYYKNKRPDLPVTKQNLFDAKNTCDDISQHDHGELVGKQEQIIKSAKDKP